MSSDIGISIRTSHGSGWSSRVALSWGMMGGYIPIGITADQETQDEALSAGMVAALDEAATTLRDLADRCDRLKFKLSGGGTDAP